jgi:ribosome-associated toxin RatA of RatAB toxin-antitoxin module
LNASTEKSFRIVQEVERFPEFMNNVTSVEIMSAEDARKVVAWEMMIDDVPLNWTEEIFYDFKLRRASFKVLDGVFERFDGYWQVSTNGTGSIVEVLVDYDLGVPEIDEIIGPILKERLIHNLEAMLSSIESYVATS